MSTPIQFFSFRSDYTRWIYVFSAHVFQHLTINGEVKDGHRKYKDADADDNDGDDEDRGMQECLEEWWCGWVEYDDEYDADDIDIDDNDDDDEDDDIDDNDEDDEDGGMQECLEEMPWAELHSRPPVTPVAIVFGQIWNTKTIFLVRN